MKTFEVVTHVTKVYAVRVSAETAEEAKAKVDDLYVERLDLIPESISQEVMAVTEEESGETVMEEDLNDDLPVGIAGYRTCQGVPFCADCAREVKSSVSPLDSGEIFTCAECERLCRVP